LARRRTGGWIAGSQQRHVNMYFQRRNNYSGAQQIMPPHHEHGIFTIGEQLAGIRQWAFPELKPFPEAGSAVNRYQRSRRVLLPQCQERVDSDAGVSAAPEAFRHCDVMNVELVGIAGDGWRCRVEGRGSVFAYRVAESVAQYFCCASQHVASLRIQTQPLQLRASALGERGMNRFRQTNDMVDVVLLHGSPG